VVCDDSETGVMWTVHLARVVSTVFVLDTFKECNNIETMQRILQLKSINTSYTNW